MTTTSGLHVEYLVSRFPRTSETFIVRELDALARRPGTEVGVRSLFSSPDTKVHDIAKPWVPKLKRPSQAQAFRGFLWALGTHPVALVRVLVLVVAGHLRNPGLLARALVTVLLACAHAKDLRDRSGNTRIHAHYATYPALAAWVCKQLIGIPYSFTAHAHDLYVDRSMLATKVDEADLVVTISQFNRKLIAESCPNTDTAVDVIHCGIDTSRYDFRPRAAAASGTIRVLTVASLQEYKGHSVLLRALALGGPVMDRIELELIGGGELLDELTALAAELGLADRVNFRGSCTEDEVRAALAGCDLFVLPSIVASDGQMEGLPVALMEALACGAPTVSTRLSGIPELVIDGVTGFLAEPGDPVGLRDAMTSAVTAAGAEQRSGAGRKLVEDEFELSKCVDELGEKLDRLATA
ncbi:glycosyltransferase [Smaragdicoccus niigatensis]|uniref:glycosyltransferase n=1 Tax=Smaragdicoccus niigatensis TaxID=359359 RepID=UPI00035CC360|nr:glycosyltransferase [Smaragdicoccus niigatensis]